MQWLLLTITWLNILKICLCECVLAYQTSFLSDHYNRAKKWLPCDMFDITGFYIPQRNLSSFKIKGSALFEDLQHFQKTCPQVHLIFWFPGQRKFWREALWKYEKKHYGNIIHESINPTNILGAYEVGARHSLAHWVSNHEQDTPGPCPPQSPSLVEEIRCYKRCSEEEVLSVIVVKPNLGLLTQVACLLTCSWVNLLMPGCGEGKCSFYSKCQARSPGQLVLKTPKLPDRFQESIFKDKVREGVCQGVWSTREHFSDWLMVREQSSVTGANIINP